MSFTPEARPHIAFLGLGTMGGGMARRLLAAGYALSVYNRSPAKAAALAAHGAVPAPTPAAAARGADLIFSMVADDAASRAVWSGPDGALEGAAPGFCAVESSTLSVGRIEELAAAVAARGGSLADAPVSGSRPEADAGTLRFLVGGPPAVLERIRPALAVMGRTIFHLGPLGSGVRFKLINNCLVAIQIAAFAEALALIERTGLDRAQVLDLLLSGAPGSPIVKAMATRMTVPEYEPPKFLLRLMAKDLAYAAGEGGRQGMNLAMAQAAIGVFGRAIAAGHGEQDMAAVVEPLRRSLTPSL